MGLRVGCGLVFLYACFRFVALRCGFAMLGGFGCLLVVDCAGCGWLLFWVVWCLGDFLVGLFCVAVRRLMSLGCFGLIL